jgi:hypothetical protein
MLHWSTHIVRFATLRAYQSMFGVQLSYLGTAIGLFPFFLLFSNAQSDTLPIPDL